MSSSAKPRGASADATAHPHDWHNLRQLVDASPDGLLVLDRNGIVVFTNDAACRMLESSALAVGRSLPPPLRRDVDQTLALAMRDGRELRVECSFRQAKWDGKRATLVVLRDVTSVKALEGHLARVNRLYAALGQTTGAMARAVGETELYEDACRIAVAFGGFRLAWIGRPSRDRSCVECIASAGPATAYLENLRVLLDPLLPDGEGAIQQAVRTGVPYVGNDFSSDELLLASREAAAVHGLASLAICPITVGTGTVTAVLCVYAAEPGYFAADLLNLLQQIATEIAGGIERLAVRKTRRLAERAQVESEARFRRMAGASRHVFWMRDAVSGDILFLSPAFATVFGRPVAAFLAQPALWGDLMHPADREAAAALVACGQAGQPATGQYRIVRGDGATRWVEEEIFPLLEAGRLVGLTGTITDITDRHHADEQLHVFRGLIESANDVFYIVRPSENFRLTFVNAAGERHFGRPVAELLQLHMWDLDRDFTPEACLVFWTQLKQQRVSLFESTHRRADGTAVRVEVATSYVRHGEDELIAGYFRDVSSRVQTAAVLREREERLREQATLLDEASDAIILRALDGTIRFWNRGAERLFGWTRDEAVGRKPEELFFRGRKPDEAATRAVLVHGVWNGELEHLTQAGARILVESRWTLIRNSRDEPRAILTINTDITEKRHYEANLLRAQRLESIGTLAGGIAHDLNNILAPIVLSGDMLRPRFVGTPDEELIDTICASARRGADVVRQVLSFARGVESTRVPVNLRHLLPEIRKIVRETFRRDITCTAEAPHDLWSVHADPTQLHQVLLNLCINAADAMPRGGLLRIEAANHELTAANLPPRVPDARPGSFVRVRVTDTGHGIAEDIRHRIFDPFFTTKGVGKGTGLGLSTGLAIMRGHGGFVTLDTEVGQGTTFTLFFPAEITAVAQPATPVVDLPRGRRELILVVDDEHSVRAIIRQSLEGAGYRTLMADDGAQGVSLFREHAAEIALVLTDLMMPVMDGLGLIKALQEEAPELRVIAMSGVTEFPDGGSPSVPSGAVCFLLKPFNLETLLTTVRATLDEAAATSSSARLG